jgi:hypothetical protein
MSVVHLPTCPICKWTMRQVRVREGDQAPRARVFECVRCHTSMIWPPETDQSLEVAHGKRIPVGWLP